MKRMRRNVLRVCAIGVSLWPVAAASQTAPSPALSVALRSHVNQEQFSTAVTAVRGLPLGVRNAMQALFGSATLDIADPGAEYQATDVVLNPKLPFRRLVAAGCSADHCLVYYERGGIARTWHAALFHWTPETTRFVWGGAAPGGLKTIDDVRKAVLSGSIKSSTSF